MDTTTATATGRRALLIGIDAYVAPNRALTGCVNDVELMRDVLVKRFHFPEGNVELLTNERATRLGILQALEKLHQATQPNDNVVIHYAGHGSQMTDREGDETNGLDSTWHTVDSCGFDATLNKYVGENRDITDDEIGIWIQRFTARTPFLTVIVDACHSGGISRGDDEESSRGTPPDRRPIEELPKSEVGPLPPHAAASESGWGPTVERYVLIAGCRDEERSMEVAASPEAGRDKPHGALTWYLTKNLLEAESGTTYKDVFEMTTAQVTREKPGQHPQMEGHVDRMIFGITDLPTSSYRLVTSRNERGEVTLRGGAAHGVTVGSRYAVYPAGGKDFSSGAAKRLGEVLVTTVTSVNAIAQIVGTEASANAIGEMCRAVVMEHAFGASRWDVACSGNQGSEAAVAALNALLDASTDVTRPAAGAEPALRAVAADGHWTVTDAKGQRVTPVVPTGQEALVAANIDTIARWHRLRARENTDPSSVMKAVPPVRLEFMKWKDGDWAVSTRDAEGRIVYEAGERIAFRIKKGDAAALFLTLLDLDPTGAVVRVWPNTSVSALTGTTPFTIASAPGEQDWTIPWPDGEPMEALYFIDASGEYVEETWLLFVTTQPADFKGDEQPGTLAAAPTAGASDRAIKMGPPKIDDDWTVVRETIRVRRARQP